MNEVFPMKTHQIAFLTKLTVAWAHAERVLGRV